MGRDGQRRVPTTDEQKNFKFVEAIFRETLRLYPSILQLAFREAAENTQIGGISVPAGTEISVNILAIHRNPL